MKLSKIIAGVSAVATSFGITVGAASAEKVLTVASWAAPFHTMNENVFPWMNSQLKSCTGGSVSLKVESARPVEDSALRLKDPEFTDNPISSLL